MFHGEQRVNLKAPIKAKLSPSQYLPIPLTPCSYDKETKITSETQLLVQTRCHRPFSLAPLHKTQLQTLEIVQETTKEEP